MDLGKWKNRIPTEPRTLIGVAGMAGLILLLAKIIEDVVDKESGGFDRAILLALRSNGDLSTPIGPEWLKGAIADITSLGSPVIISLVTFVAVSYLLVAGRRHHAWLVACAIGVGALVEKLMKIGFDRARPEIVPHFVTVHSLSFPSGHATLSAMTYLTIGALVAKAQKTPAVRVFVLAVAVLATLLIGCSRVYLGVHWPTDVLAGWTIGAVWALGAWLLSEQLR